MDAQFIGSSLTIPAAAFEHIQQDAFFVFLHHLIQLLTAAPSPCQMMAGNHFRGQVCELYEKVLTGGISAFDDVIQFPDIPRSVVADKALPDFR